MSSSYGENIKLSIFGQSHSDAIGMVLDCVPAGLPINTEQLQEFLNRRAPGQWNYSTSRKEADTPEFLSGVADGYTCGAPLCAIIHNTNMRSSDYDNLANCPRPGHADFTAAIKYDGFQDFAGGGHFSGRLTAPLCIAGGLCKQWLAEEGIEITAHISSIAGINDSPERWGSANENTPALQKDFPVFDANSGVKMRDAILLAKSEGDSVGGVIECIITGLPVGLGDPMFGGMENRIAQIIFGIPAVKGLDFGSGFDGCRLRGSENNDPFTVNDGIIQTCTNHAGGILGGITNGMPLVFRTAIKPTPSIAISQQTVNLETEQTEMLRITGRHDPCIVPRAVPVIEAAAAIAVFDALLSHI